MYQQKNTATKKDRSEIIVTIIRKTVPWRSVKFISSLRLTGSKFTKLTPSRECSPKMSLNSQRTDSVDHLCRATHSLVEISKKSRQKLKYPESKKTFSGEIKIIVHHF